MTVLSTHALSLSFGDKEILNDISFSLNEGDRLGDAGRQPRNMVCRKSRIVDQRSCFDPLYTYAFSWQQRR